MPTASPAAPVVSPTAPVAPWVRTRLRAAPSAVWLPALLVALTSFLAAVFPLALDRHETSGLRHSLAQARGTETVLGVGVLSHRNQPQADREEALRPDVLRARLEALLAVPEAPFVTRRDQVSYGVTAQDSLPVGEEWIPRLSAAPPQITLVAPQDLAGHSTIAEGRLPRSTGTVTAAVREVEAAVSRETAEKMNIDVGRTVAVPGPPDHGPLVVRITGVFTPTGPDNAYWSARPLLRTPALTRIPGPGDPNDYWHGALLLAPDAGPAILGTNAPVFSYWNLPPRLDGLRARQLPALRAEIASLESGPGLNRVREAVPLSGAGTELDTVLADHTRLRDAVAPLITVAAAGAGTVAAVVLLLTGGLAASRRRAELTLVRARGASLPALTGRLLAETAVAAVPAAALGLTAALLLVPGGRWAPAALAAGAVAVVASLALPLRAAAAHRTVRVHAPREDAVSARPSRRRTVAELTLLVLAAAAVEALRRRGVAGGSAADPLTALAPVLIAVITALVVARLLPALLRLAARPAGRLRGLVGHLAMARAGRASGPAVLPLLALLVSLATAAFGGSVLAGVEQARQDSALREVGADARVETVDPLPGPVADALRDLPGVRGSTSAAVFYKSDTEDGRRSLPVAAVDPGPYAALAARSGLGAFPAAALEADRGSGGGADSGGDSGGAGSDGAGSGAGSDGAGSDGPVLPAVASPSVADLLGDGPATLRLTQEATVTVRVVAVRELTPAVAGSHFLLVDRSALPAKAARPNLLLLSGDRPDGDRIREVAGEAATVLVRTERLALHVDSPLQSGAERFWTAAVLISALYAALALVLTQLRAAPERAALLARLRTMGLTRRQGRGLLVLESLPQALPAALGGVLAGWATVRLLAPGVDLTAVALRASGTMPRGTARLTPDLPALLLPMAAVLLLTVGVAAVQAWWTGRRGSVAELRVGDQR
ncbi:FtsX-like permease family protein [Streptomyces abyssomicinicus]|uniref:FtsX-like permease family protein n=1 Tax=Streptomyces abyssomicinicus TaxID=574929 RepID=UPI001250487F|nr:FtsX-like permease family protein [Streptomyces abyssomicinicus]